MENNLLDESQNSGSQQGLGLEEVDEARPDDGLKPDLPKPLEDTLEEVEEVEEEEAGSEERVEEEGPESEGSEEADEEEEESGDSGNPFEQEPDLGLDENAVTQSFAKLFKKRNYLPEDFDITDDLTEEQLEEAVLKHKEEELRAKVLPEVEADLKKYGYSEEVRKRNELLDHGVTEEEISNFNYFKKLGSVQFDDSISDYDDIIFELGVEYHKTKGNDQTDAERYATDDIEDLGVYEAQDKYQKHFKTKSEDLGEAIKTKVATSEKAEQDKRQDRLSRLDDFFETGKVGGKNYTKGQIRLIKDWMTNKSETIVIDGKKYKATKLEKRRYEANDFEKALQMEADLILAFNMDKYVSGARKKGKASFLSDLNNSISKKKDRSGNTDDSLLLQEIK